MPLVSAVLRLYSRLRRNSTPGRNIYVSENIQCQTVSLETFTLYSFVKHTPLDYATQPPPFKKSLIHP